MCLKNVVISIQTLMSKEPYFNQPGVQGELREGESERYSRIVQHETIRVAVCDAVDACLRGSPQFPLPLRQVILRSFLDYFEKYVEAVGCNLDLAGTTMCGTHGNLHVPYRYKTLLGRLLILRRKVQESLKSDDQERK
ncbi:hypothetical protein HPB50_011232 [Hyalomma asiaticum]|uniref:Uncharacterized protein n=1 Tax=Hyalomma asiaticum TaxID=266040 RepID=A0ACB7SE23_HYAAI|nr:hypothetical protein HPB50_011232 [Hyalomma asiaticum]